MEFITNPNQRRICIFKVESETGYTKLNVASNRTAMAQLGYSAYMLYMYFCINATGFNLILSKVALCSETKLSANMYYAAFNELVEKGYLVRKPGTQCLYNFYEDPNRAGAIPKNRTTRIEKQESRPQKAVENIKNIKNTANGNAEASPLSGCAAPVARLTADDLKAAQIHVFADI